MSYCAVGALLFVAVAMVTEVKAASCDAKEPMACTREYAPVCATFTKTFPTACVMESNLCELAKQGLELVKSSPRDCCIRPVTREHNPQCGSDGKVYDNPGVMASAGCTNKDYITAQDPANCPDFP